jgi:PAS domain S-box-containing protein
MKINTRINLFRHMIIPVSAIIVFVGIAGFFYYHLEKSKTYDEKHNQLMAIANLKAEQITQWHDERISELLYFSQNAPLSEHISRLVTAFDSAIYKTVHEDIVLFASNHDYENILIITPLFHAIYSLHPDTIPISTTTQTILQSIIREQLPVKDEIYYCIEHTKVHIDFAAPVYFHSQLVAFLIYRVNPESYLFPLIQRWPVPSKTAESILVRDEGDSVVFLNELRHRKGSAMKFRIAKEMESLPAIQAVKGKTGFFEGEDYRGERVITELRNISGTPWFMVTKIDKDEIFAELYKKGGLVLILGMVLILFSVSMIAWFYSMREKNIFKQMLQIKTDLLMSQAEYRTTLQSIGDAVITTDNHGLIQFMNPAAEALTGWTEKEAFNKPLTAVFHIIGEETRKPLEYPLEKKLRKERTVKIPDHTLLVSKQGKEIPIAESSAAIKNENDKIVGVVIVFRDNTEERAVQQLTHTRLSLFEYATTHSLSELLVQTLDEVEKLTGSQMACYQLMHPDGKKRSLQEWSTQTKIRVSKADQEKILTGRKEKIWNECIRRKEPIVYNNMDSLDPTRDHTGEKPIIARELMIPVVRNDRVVAILGACNKPSVYTEKDIETASYIADIGWEIADHKLHIEELAESYRKFNNLIDNLNGVVYRCKNDAQWTMEYVSEAMLGLSGYPASGFIENKERDFNSIIHPEDRDMVWKKTQSAIKQKAPFVLEYRMVAADGTIKWVWERGRAVFENETCIALEGFVTEITSHKRAMEALQQSQERFRSIFENSADAIFLTDKKGILTYVNKRACQLQGYTPRELLTMDIFMLAGKENAPEHQKKFQVLLEKGHLVTEFEMQKKDGCFVPVELNAVILPDGMVYGSCRDITERKENEQIIKRFSRIFEESLNEIFLFDAKTLKFVQVNNAALHNLEYSLEELKTRTPLDIKPLLKPEQFTDLIQPLLTNKKQRITFETVHQRKDKTQYPVEVHLQLLQFNKERLFAAIIVDISERKAAEDAIKKMNAELESRVEQRTLELQVANKELEAFAYSVSHDLRAPLRGIIGFTQILAEEYGSKLDAQGKHICSVIQKNTYKMEQLIDAILRFSRLERSRLNKSLMNMNLLVDAVYAELTAEAEPNAVRMKKEPLGQVYADKEMMHQVWINLLSNAIKFTSKTDNPEISISCKQENNQIIYCVKDNGTGFNMKYADKLFEVFQRLHSEKEYPGTGVGLALVHRILHRHGGNIWAHSEPGKGAEFYFSLPVEQKG